MTSAMSLVVALLVGAVAVDGFTPTSFVSSSVRGAASQLFVSTDDQKDVVIVGGGIAGLSVAYYLATKSDSNVKVTVLDRETPEQQRKKTNSGSLAAAGFLGAQNYQLNQYLEKMLGESLAMYSGWVKAVESGAENAFSRGNGAQFLWDATGESSLQPWEVNFVPEHGTLGPKNASDTPPQAFTFEDFDESLKTTLINLEDAQKLEPVINPRIPEWWSLPWVATVDARRLTCSLRAACADAGVHMYFGRNWEVSSLAVNKGGECNGVNFPNGSSLKADSVVVANGPFINQLMANLNMTVLPVKGASMIMSSPEKPLNKPLLNYNGYVVPQSDGRVLVGTTIEPNPTNDFVTLGNIDEIGADAVELSPDLKDLEIEETFSGVRSCTQDKMPILGETEECKNVYICGGLNVYGLLFAPRVGKLIGDLIIGGENVELNTLEGKVLKRSSPDRKMEFFEQCVCAP